MGVLDDAIRQHIELKRQHGASEQELERKQEEALGPARREAAAEPDDGDDASGTPFSEQETRVVSTQDPTPAVDEPPAADEAPATDEPRATDEPAGPIDDWLEPESDLPPEPRRDEPADEPEDVLEETPEFLQETPEHDRLWFEQKPPRDFDFDDK